MEFNKQNCKANILINYKKTFFQENYVFQFILHSLNLVFVVSFKKFLNITLFLLHNIENQFSIH